VTADILLIDDDPLVRKLYETALGAHQISLATASNGADGLDRLKRGLPRLVMLDVMMPQMDGVETCRRIRETYIEPFPIMFLTATDSPTVVRGVIEAGGDDFVVKGSPLSDVLTRIRFWLSTPLRGLPRSVRRSALTDAERETGPDGKPHAVPANAEAFIAGVMAKSGVAKAGAQVHDPQIHAQILGYLIGLVDHLTGRGLRQALMFPDRFSAALETLAPETRAAAADLLPKIDTLLETAKVAHAVKRGHTDAEAWERDGPEFMPAGLNFSSSID
jgi:CheY-like chemotaxis protein